MSKNAKIRNQEIESTLYIPIGQKIKLNKNIYLDNDNTDLIDDDFLDNYPIILQMTKDGLIALDSNFKKLEKKSTQQKSDKNKYKESILITTNEIKITDDTEINL